jgi:hypothetical protein
MDNRIFLKISPALHVTKAVCALVCWSLCLAYFQLEMCCLLIPTLPETRSESEVTPRVSIINADPGAIRVKCSRAPKDFSTCWIGDLN